MATKALTEHVADGSDNCVISQRAHVFHFVGMFAGIFNAIITFFNLFKSTRYLIFMIIQVIEDFYPFLALFLLTILQYSILNIYMQEKMGENGNEKDKNGNYIEGLAGGDTNLFNSFMVCWSIMLVDYDYDFQTRMGKIVYVGFTVWLIIVMLNLLISIISETHNKVILTKKATDYKVKSTQLLELSHIYRLTGKKFGLYLIKWPLILIILTPLVAVHSIVSTILKFLIIVPVVSVLERCGCKKTE